MSIPNTQHPITVLVTGANGQLGLTIQKYKGDYENVVFIFCLSKELNITKKISIKSAFGKYNPDYCINCAAYTNVEKAEEEPEQALEVNAEGVKKLAEVCKEYGTTLIHISTDYVFDGEKGTPYTVNDEPNPINEYGKSKLQGEKYIQEITENYFIVRTSWLYSKEFGKNFYRTILQKVQTEKELRVIDSQTGCPTDTENLATYIMSLIVSNDKGYGIRHFSGKKEMTWYEFAVDILKDNEIKKDLKIVSDNSYKMKAKRPVYSVLK